MISEKKRDSRILAADLMNDNLDILDEMDAIDHEEFFLNDSGRKIRLINELMKQISNDQANNIRSAFRKIILLRGILENIRNTGEE